MGREMPTDCDRCGGVVDWGDFGPDEDGSGGTTCICPDPAESLADELTLALRLLERYLPHGPCRLIADGDGTTLAVNGGPAQPLPVGACLPHQQYDGQPCRVAGGQQLLQMYGLRP